MPLTVNSEGTEFANNPLGVERSEQYTVGVTMWVTGINPLTAANFGKFIDRVRILDSWQDKTRDELETLFRPHIGTSTNTTPLTRSQFLKNFKDKF